MWPTHAQTCPKAIGGLAAPKYNLVMHASTSRGSGSSRPIASRETAFRAYVTIGDLGCYSHEDWGLPSDLSLERVWYLANLDERSGAKARGGTAALVRYLARLADREGTWLTTEVQPHNRALEKIIMALLAKHAAFTSPDQEFAAMMVRSPRVAPTPAGSP